MAISQITLWKLISGAFGLICLLLMATLGILLKNSYTKQSIQPTFSPGSMTELQEVADCCSCPEKWIGHQCNCYFISNEIKTWNESFHFCASHNSSLLQLRNRDELHFMNSTQSFYWIGLSYSEEHGAWLWEDGSSLNQDLFLSTETLNPKFCITYNPRHTILDELCEHKNYYICKK